MRNYAIKQGIDPKRVIAEDKSKTTLQNMLFSKKIIEKLNIPIDSGIFVSNNYHIFRAGIYAKQAGLNIPGLGTKTSKFFIPNAIIREYVALLANHKKFHTIMLILILIVSILIDYLFK